MPHGEGEAQKTIYRGELPKKGGLGQFADLREGAWQKRGRCTLSRFIDSHQPAFFYPVFFELV